MPGDRQGREVSFVKERLTPQRHTSSDTPLLTPSVVYFVLHCFMVPSIIPLLLSLTTLAPLVSSQFTLISPNALVDNFDTSQGFGPEDKLLPCGGSMVYIDLDAEWYGPLCNVTEDGIGCSAQEADCPYLASFSNNANQTLAQCQALCVENGNCTAINYGTQANIRQGDCVLRACNDLPPKVDPDYDGYVVYSYHRGVVTTVALDGSSFSRVPIISTPCPDPLQPPAPLSPRDTGYTVGVAHVSSGVDRLLILGGDGEENNVYYSNDCGYHWSCYDGTPNDDPNLAWDPRSFSPIVHPLGLFPNDPVLMLGGLVVEEIPSIGMFMTQDTGPNMGVNDWTRPPCPDGNCSGQACQGPYLCLPFDGGLTPSQVAYDTQTLYAFDDYGSAGAVWGLNSAGWGVGWVQVAPPGSGAGAFGRKVFLSGAPSSGGAGCFFSTDFNPLDIWGGTQFSQGVTSSSNFSVAWGVGGPWRGPFTAPWTPRVSSAIALTPGGRTLWVGGGVDFKQGSPTGAGAVDIWGVDASVCLLGPNSLPCSGLGTPNLDTVTCACGAGAAGQVCEGCAAGYWGDSCSPCAPCDPVGGVCNGGGTKGGNGACVCNPGYTGPSCATPPGPPTKTPTRTTTITPSRSPSRKPPAPAPSSNSAGGSNGLSPGGAFGVSLLVIVGVAAGGAFVFAQFFGGGPTLAAWWRVAKGGVEKVVGGMLGGKGGAASSTAAGGASSSERTPLTGGANKLSSTLAAERLAFAATQQ